MKFAVAFNALFLLPLILTSMLESHPYLVPHFASASVNFCHQVFARFVQFVGILLFLSLSPTIHAQIGNYIVLDDDSYIQIPDNNNLDLTQAMTIEAWISLCDLTGSHVIASKGCCADNTFAYFFKVESQQLKWRWSDNGACYINSSIQGGQYTTVPVINEPNRWYHLTVTHTTSEVHIYVDGIEVPSEIMQGEYDPIYNSNKPLHIGVSQAAATGCAKINFLNCFIDDVRLWNTALSPSNIQQRMSIALSGNESGLIAHYNMEQNGPAPAGQIVSNNASLTGALLNGITAGGDGNSPHFVPDNVHFQNLELGNDTSLCAGETLILDAGFSGTHYQWSNGETNRTVSISTSGIYAVTASIGNCYISDQKTVQYSGGYKEQEVHICADDSLFVQGAYQTQNGIYFDTIDLPGPCDSIVVTHLTKVNIAYEEHEETICAGETYVTPDGNEVFNQEGNYQYTLTDAEWSCDTLVVTLKLNIEPFRYAERDTSICFGTGIYIGGQLRSASGIYPDTVFTTTCDTIFMTHLNVVDCANVGCKLLIPNAFSPNNDNVNDLFRFVPTCEMRNIQCEVYDRWGRRVFATNDLTQGWDGKMGDHDLPIATYSYFITYQTFDDEVWKDKIQSGSLLLLR